MTNQAKDMETVLTALEDELMASTDEDILAGPDATEVAQRMASIVQGQLQLRLKRGTPPARMPRRVDRRGHPQQRQRPSKRQLADRVLVANPKARRLVELEQVAKMSDEELDDLLRRMRALGFLDAED